ncbi:MAG TPA: hypothetical protein VGB20_05360 [bacterium]
MKSSSALERFAEALPRLLPALSLGRVETRDARGRDRRLHVPALAPSGERLRLCIAVRDAAVPGRVREPVRQLKSGCAGGADYPMFASAYLSPRVREICREEGVGYLDLAGNVFLAVGGVYVEKAVERNPAPGRGRPASVFSPVSSRVIRVLLEDPARTWKLQDLARASRVSLGQTSNVTRALMDEEALGRGPDGLRLLRPGALLDAWRDQGRTQPAAAYPAYSFERDPDRLLRRVADTAAARGWRYAVTGFAAASLMAPFVHGIGAVSWYVPGSADVPQWMEALELRPAEAGPNAVLLLPYDEGVVDRSAEADGVTLVGAVQLYLDLCREPGRGREQAEFLRRSMGY